MQRNSMNEGCPKLLDLIPNNKNWQINTNNEQKSKGSVEENKLELRLGLPGDNLQEYPSKNVPKSTRKEDPMLSLGFFSSGATQKMKGTLEEKEGEPSSKYNGGAKGSLQVMGKESSSSSSQLCCSTRMVVDLQSAEVKGKKAFSTCPANLTAVPNTSQKRAAPAPVVGWPPIRSFRKNLAGSSSTKPSPEPESTGPSKGVNEKIIEKGQKGLFVKINMDGIPIGRKVDLTAYDSYDKLSSAVDELFRGLLAAQSEEKKEGEKAISGVLDGSGEYTLVYEDNEGDRMLVGDVPWRMFVSTVKRLRVLKSSDLATLNRGGRKQGKMVNEST